MKRAQDIQLSGYSGDRDRALAFSAFLFNTTLRLDEDDDPDSDDVDDDDEFDDEDGDADDDEEDDEDVPETWQVCGLLAPLHVRA